MGWFILLIAPFYVALEAPILAAKVRAMKGQNSLFCCFPVVEIDEGILLLEVDVALPKPTELFLKLIKSNIDKKVAHE